MNADELKTNFFYTLCNYKYLTNFNRSQIPLISVRQSVRFAPHLFLLFAPSLTFSLSLFNSLRALRKQNEVCSRSHPPYPGLSSSL
jgi:hypothetical protein